MKTPTPDEEMVSLTIKVPESWRIHWQIEAKKRRITVRQAVIDALTEKFGLPDQGKK